jgi:hypothetical protein
MPMGKGFIKNMAIILLLSITIFSVIKYLIEIKTKYGLQDSLTQAQAQIIALAQAKQNLLQELGKEKELTGQLALKNTDLKDYLRASKNRITRSFQDNARIQQKLEDTGAMFSILKEENLALIESRKRIYKENEEFKLKLSSVIELKKAIKELKIRKRRDLFPEMEGNQGFLFKDGQSTALEKIKIEVVPAQTRE